MLATHAKNQRPSRLFCRPPGARRSLHYGMAYDHPSDYLLSLYLYRKKGVYCGAQYLADCLRVEIAAGGGSMV